MASPRPYGLHVISGELTDNDINRIASVIHRFLTFKEANQLDNFKQTYDLPDGGYFIVQDMGGVFRVLADKQKPQKLNLPNDGLVKMYIPMFFSGVIEKSVLRDGEKTQIKLTQECRNRLSQQLQQPVPGTVAMQRFSIEQNPDFPEFVNQSASLATRTQYYAHNPGWYSGSMAKVMQFVGGYGIQDFQELPDEPLECIQFKIPDELLATLYQKYRDVRLPGYSGIPPLNGQFQYRYDCRKTDAVVFDTNNRPWLVRVDRKVWAMPLPIIPITADPLFHEYAQELADNELLNILETFGAMPSGEGFPTDTREFQQWVRAGVIIEICDNAEYPSMIPIFQARGWSFNSRGNAAYNTAYRYNEKGIIVCHTFRLSLNLAATDKHYGTDTANISEDMDQDSRNQLAFYIGKLFSGLRGDDSLSRSIKYKLRNIPQSEILQRAGSNADAGTEIDYWDNYVCDPIANHSGKVISLYQGNLYHPAKYAFQPQIKFPVFEMQLCVSFDFTPSEPGVSAECDTIMYAYFDNDSVKVVKYFYTSKTFPKEVETDYEDYMTVGSWYKKETFGQSTISGHFYMTDLDDREEVAPTVTDTTIKGEDRGYDTKPYFSYIHPFAMQGSLWRHRYFTHLTKSTTVESKNFNLAILVPMFNTSCVVHAKKITGGTVKERDQLQLLSVRDPYSYKYWTYDFVFAWNTPLSKQTGKPYPKDGSPVWVEIEEYNPSPSADFADNGPWIPSLPYDYTSLIHPNSNEWLQNGGGGPPKVNEYSNTITKPFDALGDLKWEINDRIVTLQTKVPSEQYFAVSPDQYGFGIVRTSSKVFLGDTEYANIDETNASGLLKYTGNSNLIDHSRIYHFIGVINE